MSINLIIMLLKEDNPIFTGRIELEEEIFFNLFSIKIFSFDEIVIYEKDKKCIVKFNEIFSVNYSDYIIIDGDKLLSIVNYYPSNFRIFEFLIEDKYKNYISHICKFISYFKINKSYNNLQYGIKLFYFLIILFFFLKDRNIMYENIVTSEQLSVQKNVYFIYKKIVADVKYQEENMISIKPGDKQQLGNEFKADVKTKKKKQVYKKGVDDEIEYFLQK